MSDRFEPSPPGVAVWSTALAALAAVAPLVVSVPATVAGLVGLVVMPVAVRRGSRRLHTVGAVALFAGVVIAGGGGAATPLVLVAAGATVVAWDAGENGIGLGRQVGARGVDGRTQLLHVAATTGVAAAVSVGGYGLFRVARTGRPAGAVVVLVLAAVLLARLLD